MASATLSQSAVSLIHSINNGYIYKAGGSNTIEVIPINSMSLTPIGGECAYNFIAGMQININGVFEDVNNEIIVYGYEDDAYRNAFIAKFKGNIFLDAITIQAQNTELISGCYGIDQNGNLCYAFVNRLGELIWMDNSLQPFGQNYQVDNGSITCVSWDEINKNFIFSGNIINKNPIMPKITFIGYFDNSFQLKRLSEFEPINGNYTFENYSEDRTVHSLINGSDVILCQPVSISTPDLMDALWIKRIDYISGQTIIDRLYIFPSPKLIVYDMAYNPQNNNIYILGRFIGCPQLPSNPNFGINCIAQLDLNNLSLLRVYFPTPPPPIPTTYYCPPKFGYYNDIYLKQMFYNHLNNSIISSGVAGESIYSIETFDIKTASCGKLTTILGNYIADNRVFYPISTNNPLSTINCHGNVGNTIVNCNVICSKATNPNFDDSFDEQNIDESGREAIIKLIDSKNFVCENFSGKCEYQIFDNIGKLLQKGITENGNNNKITININGLITIRVIDEAGTEISKKVILIDE